MNHFRPELLHPIAPMRMLVATLCGAAFAAWLAMAAPAQEPKSKDGKKVETVEQREARATAAIESVRRLVGAKKDREAWDLLDRLRFELADTAAVKSARQELDRLAQDCGVRVVGPAAAFRARVEMLSERRLRITYDFTDETVLDDFVIVNHVGGPKPMDRVLREPRGTGALVHRAVFTKDLSQRWELSPQRAVDFGPLVLDADDQTPRFLVGVANNSYFGVKYDESRRVTRGHCLLFAGRGAVSRARTNPSQMFGDSVAPLVEAKKELAMELAWKKDVVTFRIGETVLSHAIDPATQSFPRRRIGLHLVDSVVRPLRLVIEGELDPRWAEARLADGCFPAWPDEE